MAGDCPHFSSVSEKNGTVPRSATKTPRKHWAERRRASISLCILLPIGALVALSPPRVEPGSPLDLALNALAWGLFLVGGAFRLWATLHIGGNKGKTLITDGPYSITRNPLYLGTLLIGASTVVFLQSLSLLAALIVASSSYLFFTLRSERNRLRSHHGAEYDRYCEHVPMLLPNVRLFKSPERIELDVHCLRLEALRALRWLPLPLFAALVMQLRHVAAWPLWFNLP